MTRRRVSAVTAGLATVAALSLIACRADRPTGLLGGACAPRGPFMGQFEGSLSGALSDSVAGCAYFFVEQVAVCGSAEPSYAFHLILSNGELGKFEQAVALDRCGQRPVAGAYQVGPELGRVSGRLVVYSDGRFFMVTGGTIDVSASEAGTLTGAVTLTATEEGGTATLGLTGSFTARCLDPNRPPRNDEGRPESGYTGSCDSKSAG